MGGLHPRAKQTIGRRLALAAANVAYNQPDVPFTGPVIKTCNVLKPNAMCMPGDDITSERCQQPGHNTGIHQQQISMNFNEELLGADAGTYECTSLPIHLECMRAFVRACVRARVC